MITTIELLGLQKNYGQQAVLTGVNLTVTSGEIVGLIGPSGAGKSTVIKVMLGMEQATDGQAKVLGQVMPARTVLGRLGYMAQADALYESLTGRENLRFFGAMKGLTHQVLATELMRVAAVVDLTAALDRRVATYSGGMKRRLSLALALLGQPDLLILDEPTVGIDPVLRRNIWTELARLRDAGCSILVTTHVMAEAELVDRVALLVAGRIKVCAPPTDLEQQYQVASIEEVFLRVEGGE